MTRLQEELKKIKTRLDLLYVDKLDGTVSEAFWLEKSRQWELEQDRSSNRFRDIRARTAGIMKMALDF